ncbi:Longin-like domain-containing protein [Pavlovales sp. CCMP2436]|nr:Longin-like domain-containing protein [Pavlovales sp. CCMP2436]
MIDHFVVLLKSGIVLFIKSFSPLSSDSPVDCLIRDVLLEERHGENSYSTGSFTLKWTQAPDLGVLLVVAYQKILQLAYIDELLEVAKTEFAQLLSAVPVARRAQLYPYALYPYACSYL